MNFFLDNCLPPSWAPAVSALAKNDGHIVTHLRQKFKNSSIEDIEWIRDLGKEDPKTVIISADERITRNPHERRAWQESHLTAFFLASGWANQKFWDKTWMFIRWFPTLAQQARIVEPGAGFLVPVQFGPNKLRPI